MAADAVLVARARGNGGPFGEPTMTSSLDQLVAGSQGMIGKRIDLALLDGQEVLSRSLRRLVLIGTALLLAVGGWFACTWAFVLWAAPAAGPVFHLAAFGMLSAAGAAFFVALARRADRTAPPRAPNSSSGSSPQSAPIASGRRGTP